MKADAQTASEVRQALSDMAEQYEKRNLAGVLARFSPDADVSLLGTGEDEYRRGLAAVETQITRDWAQTDAIAMRFPDPDVSASGDVAWTVARGAFEISAGGQQMTMPARATFVLERREGGWRIAQAHFSTPAAGQEEGSSIPG